MNKNVYRFSLFFLLLGGCLLAASRFLDTDALVSFSRELRFRYRLEKWQYYEIVRRINFVRDALWLVGFLVLAFSSYLLIFQNSRVVNILEKLSEKPMLTLFCFFLLLQGVTGLIFTAADLRLWSNKMYDYSPPGGVEQRSALCGGEYVHARKIREALPGDDEKVLLGGKHVDPFFINYYLYPYKLYFYDNRPLPGSEINEPYVKKWMQKKGLKTLLMYTPFDRRSPWNILTLEKKNNDGP